MDISGVETFSMVVTPRNEVSRSQWSCREYVLRDSYAANERVFDDHVVNNRKTNLKRSSVSDFFFLNSALRKKRWSLTRFHIFTLQCFLRPVGFEVNHWINCHWRWNALHEFSVGFRHTVTVSGLERKQCGLGGRAGEGWEGVRGRVERACGAAADKTYQHAPGL